MNMPKMQSVVLHLAIFACLSVLLPLQAQDQITLNDGRVIEGRIISENAAEIQLEVGGLRQKFQKSRISEITRDTESLQSPAAQKILRAEQTLESGENPVPALRAYFEAVEEDSSLAESFNVLGERLVVASLNAIPIFIQNGNGEEALATCLLMESDASREIINSSSQLVFNDVIENIRISKGRSWTLIGISRRDQNNFSEAVEAYSNALGIITNIDQDFPEIQRQLGIAYSGIGREAVESNQFERARQNYLMALDAFQAAEEHPLASATIIPFVREQFANIRDNIMPQINARLNLEPEVAVEATPFPTPSPIPTPVAEVPAGETEQEEEPVTPVAAGPGGFLIGIIGEQATRSFQETWRGIFGETGVLTVLGILIGIIAVYWILPFIFLNYRVGKLDIIADQWKKRIWFAGIFAVMGWGVSLFMNREKKDKNTASKHPCPHCGNGLDDPMLYANLQFEYCPNCGGEVKALYDMEDYISLLGENMNKEADRVQNGTGSMQDLARKDSMQRLVRALIVQGSRCRASDIHIEPSNQGVSVRQRVDGVMMEMVRLDTGLGPAIVSAIKVSSDLDISEKRKPQDGSMQMNVDDYMLDLRVATSPSQEGETATLRLLDSRTLEMSTKNLGMTKSARELFEAAIYEPHGLVLATGPTGSGKTTSLYVALQMLGRGDKNIISIEDPIEFRLSGINQIQVNPTAGLTFASGLRSMLRQDPDVIMVGEIRDHETAEISVNAAQTGHLVFSTLHTIDAAASVTRLFDLKISPRQFADALSLVVAQRLIRMVCPNCRKDLKIKDSQLEELQIPKAEYDKYKFVTGKGCSECLDTGYLGRTGIFELLLPNSTIRGFLQKGDFSTVELRELAIANGMRTLREEALVLLRQQMTTVEEVSRITK